MIGAITFLSNVKNPSPFQMIEMGGVLFFHFYNQASSIEWVSAISKAAFVMASESV